MTEDEARAIAIAQAGAVAVATQLACLRSMQEVAAMGRAYCEIKRRKLSSEVM